MAKTKSKTTDKKEKPLAQIIDETIQKGGKWEDIVASINKVADKRGMKEHTAGTVKGHIRYRLKKDKKFYGKLKMTDEGIEVS